MQITVKLFASFRTGRFDIETREYPDGTTVGDVADQLNLTRGELGIMMINNRHVKCGHIIADGDTLALFPLLGGG
ncbi:MAG TPA: MoaD/ThiS family protein [Desulfuromonadales bacterium]|nr:MoaD/ThiS family protein [Desulfuromonadales bacterium]